MFTRLPEAVAERHERLLLPSCAFGVDRHLPDVQLDNLPLPG